MNAVVYCRVSSKEQIEGTSLESQQAACREYAKSKNIDILKVFIEQGESAKFADRTQLLELVDFCRKNKGSVHALLVWKVDRFARNVADHFSVKATLGKYGVRIVSVTEPIDANPEGKLMETILAGFAQFDNDVRAMRTVQGMRRKLQEGIFPWRPPFGYKSAGGGKEKKTQPDLPDQAVFGLLRRAFTEYAKGAYTQAEMGRRMNSWGLFAPDGKPFAPQSLANLFANPFYAGILVDPWTGEEHAAKHVPLVTRELFARVQMAIASRNRSAAHRKEREEFPLRGIVRCGACEHELTAAFSRGRSKRYPYYLCGFRECPRRGRGFPASEVDCEYRSFLDEIAPRRELIHRIRESVIELAAQAAQDVSREHGRRRKRLGRLEAEVSELIRMRAQQLITDDEFATGKKRLADQRFAIESHQAKVPDVAQVQRDIEKILEPLTNLRATWESLRPPFRGRFDHLLLPGGFIARNVRTAQIGRLFDVFRASGHLDSSEVALGTLRSNQVISEIHEFSEIISGMGCRDDELPTAVRT